MKNKFIASVLLASMTFSSVSVAQDFDPEEEAPRYTSPDVSVTLPPMPEPSKFEPDVGEAVSPMKKGQTAPFTGLLFSPAATATIIADIESKRDEIRIEVQKAVSELNVKHNHEMTIARIRNESDSKIDKLRIETQQRDIDRLAADLKKQKEEAANPFVWAAIGVGAGVLLSTLTAAVIVSVTNNN